MKPPGEATILRLWREVVLVKFGRHCAFCGSTQLHIVDCHHIVRRDNLMLKYDWRNGIPLCRYSCHRFGETKAGREKIAEIMGDGRMAYLNGFKNKLLKSHLSEIGMGYDEFIFNQVLELKREVSR